MAPKPNHGPDQMGRIHDDTRHSGLLRWFSEVMFGRRPHQPGLPHLQQGVARPRQLNRNRILREHGIIPGVGENIS